MLKGTKETNFYFCFSNEGLIGSRIGQVGKAIYQVIAKPLTQSKKDH